ncbi:hypothetical protein HRbin01_00068 [archaeon HR01]|nr:hypothetical protein HRbin01_00068 [archaeon HR01]
MTFRRIVSYGEESVYGVPAEDLSQWIGGATKFSGGVELASEDVASLSGIRRRKTMVHGVDTSPQLEYYVQTGRFFKYGFGSVSNTGTSPPYIHTLRISDGYELPSITLLEHRISGAGGHGYLYTGCRVESITVSWEEDGLLTSSVELLAQRPIKTTSLPSVEPDTRDYFRSSSKTVTINGVENSYVLEGSISLTNNHVRLPRVGDYQGRPIADVADITAELTLYYLDSSIYELMLNKTLFDVVVRFQRSASDYIEFRLFDCYASVDSELAAEGELMQTLTLKPSDLEVEISDDIPAY